jgi:uncharacterized membrane protein YedE/YeeE
LSSGCLAAAAASIRITTVVPTEFTPLPAAIGGALIGASAVLLMLLYGRIAGISGILGRLLPPYRDAGPGQAAAFIFGLVAAPVLYGLVTGNPVLQTVSESLPLMAVGGLLVGFGATWGGGCTSGHGVCGLARLSARSFVATLTFMATAIATVFIARHVVGA